MLKGFYLPLFLILSISFSFSQEKILFVGHAYGNPNLKDKKLDSSLINFLNVNKNDKIIYGGDFIYDIKDTIEIKNFLKFNSKFNYVLIPGNHDVGLKFLNHQKTRFEQINNNLLIYLNTNFNSTTEILKVVEEIKNEINKDYKNILIFSHQLFYSKSIFDIRTNSRDNYDLCNEFNNQIIKFLKESNKEVFIYSGDIGAFKYIPYAYFNSDKNIKYFAVGLGNGFNNKAIEINFLSSGQIFNNFIDLNTSVKEEVSNYSRLKVKLYQTPKLFLYLLKTNFYFLLVPFLYIFYFYLKKSLKNHN
tara:strand:+ start:1058 stop:1969 length:912 start_codon:yes stop_codon:yes gene_type:complete